MKIIKTFGLLTVMVLGLVSCNDQLDINRDPDSLDPTNSFKQ